MNEIVRIGQVYRDQDRRNPGRTVRIVGIAYNGATVTVRSNEGVTSRISTARLLSPRLYRIVEAPATMPADSGSAG